MVGENSRIRRNLVMAFSEMIEMTTVTGPGTHPQVGSHGSARTARAGEKATVIAPPAKAWSFTIPPDHIRTTVVPHSYQARCRRPEATAVGHPPPGPSRGPQGAGVRTRG